MAGCGASVRPTEVALENLCDQGGVGERHLLERLGVLRERARQSG